MKRAIIIGLITLASTTFAQQESPLGRILREEAEARREAQVERQAQELVDAQRRIARDLEDVRDMMLLDALRGR